MHNKRIFMTVFSVGLGIMLVSVAFSALAVSASGVENIAGNPPTPLQPQYEPPDWWDEIN